MDKATVKLPNGQVVELRPGVTAEQYLAAHAETAEAFEVMAQALDALVTNGAVFSEQDPATWGTDEELPTGYAWIECVDSEGEFHLIAPDGRDLSQAHYDRQDQTAWLTRMSLDPGVEMIGGHPYGKTSGLPIMRNVIEGEGILARHRRMIAEGDIDPDTLTEMRDEESMARIAPLTEDEPACVVVVGEKAVRAVADRMRVRAYLIKATQRRNLTRVFKPTIKGFNADYGTSCRSWADVTTEARKMLG